MLFSNSQVSDLFLLALAMGFISPSLGFEGWQKRFTQVCTSTQLDMGKCTLKASCTIDKSKKNDKNAAKHDSVLDLNKCFGIFHRPWRMSSSEYDFDWKNNKTERVVTDNFCQHTRYGELDKQIDPDHTDDHEYMQRLHVIGKDQTYGFEQWPFLDEHIESKDGHLECFGNRGT
ncbi:hypothetical protein QBC45DRAFT_425131 [Copromyces sp. CBS 386.78]|nr:hypothetical protein QBC45DRAFT_425131 [Copromyces sp. CBS 386.78]